MQSLPSRRIVGQSCFLRNFEARCDRPGIDDTSSGVGISRITFGNSWVMAFSSMIGSSPDSGLMMRFLIIWLCVIGLGPCIVVVEWAYGIWSDL